MNEESVHAWANAVVRRQPVPPREVDLSPLLRLEYRSQHGKYLLILGLLGVVGFVLFALAPGGAAFRMIGQVVAAGLAVWSVVRPVRRAARLRSTLRSARLGKAIVLDAAFIVPRDAGKSVDSLRHGMAIGHWRIADGADEGSVFAFSSDAPWAASLTPGTQVDVLLDGENPVWELGLSR